MPDRFEHPSMDPANLYDLLRWLYDGYGGNLSEHARELILAEIVAREQIASAPTA